MKQRFYRPLASILFTGAILIAFLLALNAPFATNAHNTSLTLAVDVSREQGTISPYIYGMNFAEQAIAEELTLPINRWGGNATTRYNWLHDTSNRASDWFFENIPNENASPGLLLNGSASDKFVKQNLATGSASLLTVLVIGWTPKSRGYHCAFSVRKYGEQQQVDPLNSDCGYGIGTDGTPITDNDPLDASSAIDESFVQAWIEHLTSRYGQASQGGVSFYSLDNEPMLWNMTHRDVHPSSTSYDEIRDRSYQYGVPIKYN